MIWIAPLLTMLSLMSLSYLLHSARQQASQRTIANMTVQMERTLNLIQQVQKHRGLGVQQTAAAQRQREQVVTHVERSWVELVQGVAGLPWAQAATHEARQRWELLRSQPSDFDGHCRLLDQLLTMLALLERRAQASTIAVKVAVKVAVKSAADLTVTTRCRDVEDLARLRGLAARAAGHARCPIQLEVPLRFLCQRVAAVDRQLPDAAVGLALREVQQKLLDSVRVEITAARCFELLTPSIDRRLDELRQSFHTSDARVMNQRVGIVRSPLLATNLAT